MSAIFDTGLGRDFLLFRMGQLVSLIGDSCGGIALAWWILERTGSATEMAAVLAPAMFARVLLMPLFGPIGDRFSRKWIVVWSNTWRLLGTAAIAGMVLTDYYNLPLLIGVFVALAAGSAAFNAVSSSIIPQLVDAEHVPEAMRKSQAVDAVGGVAGGLAGGIIVTFLGVGGAFVADAGTYLLAALAASFLRTRAISNAVADAGAEPSPVESHIKTWARDLGEGFQTLLRIPTLFWLAVLAMFLNLVIAPIGLLLPILVKEGQGMAPWFLGALESSAGVGTIIGALGIGFLLKRIAGDYLALGGIALIGLGMALMPFGIEYPIVSIGLIFLVGFGAAIANVITQTQNALAVPDRYRSRLDSILGFMSGLAAPLGTAIAGILLKDLGLAAILHGAGLCVILATPLLLLIPRFSEFHRAEGEEIQGFFDGSFDAPEEAC